MIKGLFPLIGIRVSLIKFLKAFTKISCVFVGFALGRGVYGFRARALGG